VGDRFQTIGFYPVQKNRTNHVNFFVQLEWSSCSQLFFWAETSYSLSIIRVLTIVVYSFFVSAFLFLQIHCHNSYTLVLIFTAKIFKNLQNGTLSSSLLPLPKEQALHQVSLLSCIYDVRAKGAPIDFFPFVSHLVCDEKQQITSEAIEASRVAINKYITKHISKDGYHTQMRAHPFHVLRANKMLSWAGAYRLSSGMRHSYGKPIGVSARVDIGQILLSVRSKDTMEPHSIESMRRGKFTFAGRQKLPQMVLSFQLIISHHSLLIHNFLLEQKYRKKIKSIHMYFGSTG